MPRGIVIVGVLVLLSGLYSLLWGLALTGLGGLGWATGLVVSDPLRSWGGNAFGAGLWSMLVGVVQLITGFGLFGRRRWAWLLALVSAGAALATALVGLLGGSLWSLSGVVIPGLILYCLLGDPDVKRAFGRAPAVGA